MDIPLFTSDPLGIRVGDQPHRLPLAVAFLGESTWRAGHRFQRERSEVMAVEVVLEGRIRLVQAGRESLVGPGEVFMLKRGARHVYEADGGPVRKLWVGLAGSLAEQLIAGLPDRVRLDQPAEVQRCWRALAALYRRRPADVHLRASALAYRLLTLVLVADQAVRRTDGHGARHPALAAALGVIEQDGLRATSVSGLARSVGVSPAHLHRLFHQQLGTSPLRYARDLLVRQAKEALSDTDLPCREIARRLGFSDPLYFSAVFRRSTGESPTRFRQRHR